MIERPDLPMVERVLEAVVAIEAERTWTQGFRDAHEMGQDALVDGSPGRERDVRFENTEDLKGAEFLNVDLSDARGRNVNLSGARIMEATLVNARFSGLILGLVINDVEVGPLIAAEMDRRYPERTKLKPTDADGVRDAWSVIEELWAASKVRAAGVPEAKLHARVDGEWSFVENFRHLIMVTDGWISGTVLGRTDHYHPFGVAPSFIVDPRQLGIDVDADPSFAEVVAVREGRLDVVRELVADLSDDDLEQPRGEQTVLRCLLILLDEEWHHNWFANRDLDMLTTR
jgi:hypothetical protein